MTDTKFHRLLLPPGGWNGNKSLLQVSKPSQLSTSLKHKHTRLNERLDTELVTEKHSENQRSFLVLMSQLNLSSSCLMSRDTLPQSNGDDPGTIAVSARNHNQQLEMRCQGGGKKQTDPVSPVFPVIFSQGWSVMMLRSSGVISGVSDHSRTVLSRLQLAMVNGRL